MANDKIIIKGANEHNLKNVDVEIVKISAPVCAALDFSQYPEE